MIENFCGDLTVREVFEVRGKFLLRPQGPDGLAYGMENVHGTVTTTNLANGKTLTETFNNVFKDLKVTDNGDGTLTLLVLGTGGNKIYGPDGKLLFNNPGQIRFELLIDHGGTPADPFDDEEIEFLGLVKGSTGRNDAEGLELCEIMHTYIG